MTKDDLARSEVSILDERTRESIRDPSVGEKHAEIYHWFSIARMADHGRLKLTKWAGDGLDVFGDFDLDERRREAMSDALIERLLLRPAEAADVLGVGRSKVYELIAEGAIPTVKVGSRTRIPVDDLRAWIRDGATTPGGAKTLA